MDFFSELFAAIETGATKLVTSAAAASTSIHNLAVSDPIVQDAVNFAAAEATRIPALAEVEGFATTLLSAAQMFVRASATQPQAPAAAAK